MPQYCRKIFFQYKQLQEILDYYEDKLEFEMIHAQVIHHDDQILI